MFEIPKNLGDLTPEALRRYREQAAAEYNTALAAAQGVSIDQVTNEQLDRMEALAAFVVTVDDQLATDTGADDGATDGSGADDTGTGASATDRLGALAPVGDAPADADPGTGAPTVADVAGKPLVSETAAKVVDAALTRASITASAGVTGYSAGQVLDGLTELAAAASNRLEAYLGLSGGIAKDPVAAIKLAPSEHVVTGDRRDLEVLAAATDESKLPGGNLVAARLAAFKAASQLEALTASGWCAPSEIDYSVQFNGAASGLYDVPTVTANRGGLWVMPEMAFATIFGTAPAPGSSYFSFTEAQIIAGATKTFVEVDCPTPVEYRLGVTGLGIVAPLLELRAYPEYVREFVRASLIGLQHFRSMSNIAAVVAGSTAVSLAASLPWTSDSSVLSVVLPAAEMAAVDQRYRARLEPTATIEQVFPIWILAQMRADVMRRNGTGDNPTIADAWIMDWFAQRHIAPQFVYNWQDSMDVVSGGATFPGAAVPVTALPTTLKFLSYPAGTWVNATADVIQLSTVYDSVRLASNTRVELFSEQGGIMVPRKADSRVYTVTICPTGATSAQQTVTCTTNPG